jgi:hypothetical protein
MQPARLQFVVRIDIKHCVWRWDIGEKQAGSLEWPWVFGHACPPVCISPTLTFSAWSERASWKPTKRWLVTIHGWERNCCFQQECDRAIYSHAWCGSQLKMPNHMEQAGLAGSRCSVTPALHANCASCALASWTDALLTLSLSVSDDYRACTGNFGTMAHILFWGCKELNQEFRIGR